MRLRVIFPILLALLLAAVIGLWSTSRAEAVMTTTGSCTDGGGIIWRTRVDWGGLRTGSQGQRRVTVDFAGWTTNAQSQATNAIVRTYNPDGVLRRTQSKSTQFDYDGGTTWDGLDPANPIDGPGRAKITISVGGNADDTSQCVVEHVQPASIPSPTPVSTAPTSTVTPTSTSGSSASVLALPRDTWEGADYWKQFAKADAAGWDDPGFFPIAVFFGKPSHADALKTLGVNTYMGAEHDGSSMSSITSRGLSVLAQGEWSRSEVGDNNRVVGWHVSDECEMGYSGCTPDWNNDNGEFGRLAKQQTYVDTFHSYNDGRFLQANFGNGVLRTYWAPSTMDDHVRLMDVSSVDKYAYTSPHVQDLVPSSPDWPEGADPKRAATYGWLQDQMERFQDPATLKPNWVFIETAKPNLTEAGATTIAPDQISGAVWSAIIHGARGIAYFQHNNNGVCGTYSLVDCSQTLKDRIRTVNSEIANIAPVLNTQSYLWDFHAGADTMLKIKDGYAYVFAGVGLKDTPGAKTFSLPSDVKGSTAEVVGESRSISVINGKFTDALATEYAHHIYKISLAN